MIHDAQLDYYGRRLATCSSDRSIKIYDLSPADGSSAEPVFVAELSGHEGPVWQVAWSHPSYGPLLASAGYDRRVLIHRETQPGNWIRIFAFEGHSSSVNSVAWAPFEYGALQLACGSSDGKLSILSHKDDDSWSFAMMDDAPSGVNAVSWAPAHHLGARAAAQGPITKRIATAGCDNLVHVYASKMTSQPNGGSAESWALEATLPGHREWVRDVAFAPSTGLAVNMLASCSDDGTVIIWTQRAAGGEWAPERLPTHFSAPVWRVSWSTTGTLLAVSCGDNSVTLWKQTLGGQWVQVTSVPDPSAAGFSMPAQAAYGAQQHMGVAY